MINAKQVEQRPSPKAFGRTSNTPAVVQLPLDDHFRAAMERFGPFERAPHLAVAVSGGSDSMALCRLAANWVREVDGRLTALTVDHGLRPNSADEARWVAAEMTRIGVNHHVLSWTNSAPASGLQAAARVARYGLLRQWCMDAGVLHLLTGHQSEDQAETHLMRAARTALVDATGNLGLAGMSACVEYPEVRLLRPLLAVSRRDLAHYLKNHGQGWLEDPSNQNVAFERVRARQRLTRETGMSASALSRVQGAGIERRRMEKAVNQDLARCLTMHPAGFAHLHIDAMRHISLERHPLILARAVMALGGLSYAPRLDRLKRLSARITSDAGFKAASLGGCRFLTNPDGNVLICRENRNLPPAHEMAASDVERLFKGWDGRFDLLLPAGLPENICLRALGASGWRQIPKPARAASGIPHAAAQGMPALFNRDTLYWSPIGGVADTGVPVPTFRFRPKNTLAFTGFCIA